MRPTVGQIRGLALASVTLLGPTSACARPPATIVTPSPQSQPALVAPEREPQPDPSPAPERLDNSGEALVAHADRITHLELSDGERALMRFDDAVRDELVDSLRDEIVSEGLSASAPPWPGYFVLVYIEGHDAPIITSLRAVGGLRVNARDPYSLLIADDEGVPDFENIKDVGYSELLYDAVSERLGHPRSKEYQAAPPPRPSNNKGHKGSAPDLVDPFK